MLSSSDILYSVLLPMILAAAILLVAWRPWKRGAGSAAVRGGYWGGPLAIGTAFMVAFGWVEGPRQLFPPGSAIPWLFYLAGGFTLLGLIDALMRPPLWLRGIIVFLAMGVGAGWLLRFNFTNETWDALHGGAWIAAIAGMALLWWASFERAAVGGEITAPLAMMMVVGVGAIAVAAVVDQTIGQGLGAMAVGLTAAVVLALWSGRASLERGTAIVVAGVGVSALAAAYFVSDLAMSYVLLIGLSPALLWVGRVPVLKKMRPWQRVTIQIVLLLIPLGIAGAMAIAQFQRDAAEKSNDRYSYSLRESGGNMVLRSC